MPASYFLGNRLLASSAPAPWWSDSDLAHHSQAFFCPTCGEIWGRIAVDNLSWMAVTAGCVKHPQWPDEVGGSFIHPWCKGCPRELPFEVLQHELQIRLNQLENEP